MRNKFFEYYILSDKEHIQNIWSDALIVLDTNVLLNLYRYSEDAKENQFAVFEHYKDRLWLPYQVALEYHQNRISVYSEMNAAYDQIADALDKESVEFIKKLNLSKYSRHPKIETKWFENQIKGFIAGLCDQLLTMKASCNEYPSNDDINDRITDLFDGKVGDDFELSKLKDLYKEGQTRYCEKIPPGYCDSKDKKDRGNRHLYGDLILWKQVIQEACDKQRNIILVTDDVKEDWYERVKGKTIGPRKELLQEFRAETQKDVLIYPTNQFLHYAKENMSVSVSQETISEANEIHKENEAIDDIISSMNEVDDNLAAKMFSENPWMSAESLLQTLGATVPSYIDHLTRNPLENLAATVPSYIDHLTKNPLENLAATVPNYIDLLTKRNRFDSNN